MRRYRSILLFCLWAAIPIAQAEGPQEDQKIHPPKWAIGVWQNLAQNDTRRIVTLEISNDSIRISRGLQSPAADLLGQHPGWSIKEYASDYAYLDNTYRTYRIEFRKDSDMEIFELMFHPSDHPDSHGYLTYYSGSPPVLITAHPTSINWLFMKIAEPDTMFMPGK